MDRYFVVEREGQYLSEAGNWGTMATAAHFGSEQEAIQAASLDDGAEARVLAGYAVTQSKWAIAGGHSPERQSND